MIQAAQAHKAGFSIGASCPGCGGELELQRGFFVLTCSHCNSVVRVIMPHVPPAFIVRPRKSLQDARFLLSRYCREQGRTIPSASSPGQFIYYPYWKIDAITLKVRSTVYEVDTGADENGDNGRTEERETTSVNLAPFTATQPAGISYSGIPYSLGMRTDYINLAPFIKGVADDNSVCLPVVLPFNKAAQHAAAAAINVGQSEEIGSHRSETRLFHPTGSIVYFPYVAIDSYCSQDCRRFIIDGLSGRVVGDSLLVSGDPAPDTPTAVEFGALQVALHRCSNCGVDLPSTLSVVYQCHNCGHIEFFEAHPQLSQKINTLIAPNCSDAQLLPFWSLELEGNFSSRNLLGGIITSNKVMIPAFVMRNIEVSYRLAKRMTNAFAHFKIAPLQEIGNSHAPVSRSIADAITLLEVLWYREMAGRDIQAKSDYVAPPITTIDLIFAPFRQQQYFFVDSCLNAVTFESSSLAVV